MVPLLTPPAHCTRCTAPPPARRTADPRCRAVAMLLALAPFTAAQQQGAGSLATVTSARGFRAAMQGGVEHIHITEHLDLRGLPTAKLPDCDACDTVVARLFLWPAGLQTITVRTPRPMLLIEHLSSSQDHGFCALVRLRVCACMQRGSAPYTSV